MILTRCPACTTTFRVTPEQLKARQGQVRCGRCQHVFNAIEHLAEEEPLAGVEEAPAAPTPLVEPSVAPTLAEDLSAKENSAVETPVAALEIELPAEPEHEPEEAEVSIPEFEHGPSVEEDDPHSLLDADYLPPIEEAHRRRWPWVVGMLLASVILIVQALVAYRVELAARHPDSRPLLEALCAQLSCTVGLPTEADQIGIEASDLEPSASQKGLLELTATLKNHAAYAQSWPYLELTLTDTSDKPLARKVIEPALYLAPKQGQNLGFPANGDMALKVSIDPGDIPAVGYRLYLFYP